MTLRTSTSRTSGTSCVPRGRFTASPYDLFAAKLAEHQPSLVMVNFKDVDEIAHTGDWNGYLNAIVNVDLLIYRIWTELIQANPHYADKTTMIVTSDHGRNDDSIGFDHHGGMSPANLHLPFLAIGPDTPLDFVVTEKRFQIDLAPTVGEMLDFPTPFAHGQVMTGMIDPALGPDPRIRVYGKNARAASYNDSAVARWGFFPAVAANKNGVHVVWLDSRPHPDQQRFLVGLLPQEPRLGRDVGAGEDHRRQHARRRCRRFPDRRRAGDHRHLRGRARHHRALQVALRGHADHELPLWKRGG